MYMTFKKIKSKWILRKIISYLDFKKNEKEYDEYELKKKK